MNDELKMSEKQMERALDSASQLVDGVTTIADTKGISAEELEAVYGIGFAHYNAGHFDEAYKVFKFLTVFSHTNPKYWTALGSVHQAKREFAEAMRAYAYGAIYDITKPKPHFFAAQCALALGDLASAESGVLTLLDCCPAGSAENDEYRKKAEALLKKIREMKG